MMDYNHLRFGTAVASESQMRRGIYAPTEFKTGPNVDYCQEAENIIKEQVVKQDTRVKNTSGVHTEKEPEKLPSYYGSVDKRRGYIGNGRFRVFFWYIVRETGKSRMVCGYGVAKINQSVVGFGLVRQVMTLEELKITRSE